MGMPVAPTFDQDGFRFRDNVPDPSGVDAAFDAGDTAANSNPTLEVDTLYRVRLLVKQTNGSAVNHADLTTEFLIQYNNGGAGWNDFGAVGGGTEDIDFASATGFADGDNTTTQRLGSGTQVTGDGMEVAGASDSVAFTAEATTEAELEISFIINSGQVADEDTIQIRVLYSAGDASPPATAMSGTTIPTITVNEVAPTSIASNIFNSTVFGSGVLR